MLRIATQLTRQRFVMPTHAGNHLLFGPQRSYASRGANQLTTLIEAVQASDKTTIMRFAKENPRLIAEQTSNDNTALHEAAKRGDVKMIEVLSKEFSEHFNVNHKCHCHLQRTPLHYAAEGGHMGATETLLNLGADPNIKDEKGRTVLDYALEKKDDTLALLLYKKGGTANVMKGASDQLGARVSAKLFAEKYVEKRAPEIAAIDNHDVDDFIKKLIQSKNK